MRKLVVSEFVSLDGVMDAPAWTAPYWNDEIANFKNAEQLENDALLLGRVTYEGFAQAWPNSEDPGAARMNSVTKYVVTTTLDKAEWSNSTIIRENVMEEINRLRQQDGGNILVYGSGELVNSLIEAGLVDEYRLLVYPVVLGEGKRLFKDGSKTTLKLTEVQHFSTGVAAMIYQSVR